MIPRNSPEYRQAKHGRVTASDAGALMAADGTKRHRDLIERLVLDREGIPDHRDEQAEPWEDAHELALVAALAAYKRLGDATAVPGGLCVSRQLSWLAASPHALIDGGAVLFRPHVSLRAFHGKAGTLDRAWRVRTQITCFVCEVPAVELVDFWDGLSRVPDRLEAQRIGFDYPWLSTAVLPRLVSLWQDVDRRLRERREPPRTVFG